MTAPGIDLSTARITWEVRYLNPTIGLSNRFTPKYVGDTWIEAEALLPDGRRVIAKTNFTATTSLDEPPNSYQSAEVAPGSGIVSVYHLNNVGSDSTGIGGTLAIAGNTFFDVSNLGWLQTRSGAALRFLDLNDSAVATLPGTLFTQPGTESITLEAMIYINEFKAWNRDVAQILRLENSWDAYLALMEDKYAGPCVKGGGQFAWTGTAVKSALALKKWHHFSIQLDRSGYSVRLNGNTIASGASTELANWGRSSSVTLTLGDFDGWIDEVVIRRNGTPPGNNPPTATLTSPVNGSTLAIPATLSLTAIAADTDGIAKVEFFSGATKLGEDSTAPYTLSWTPTAGGSFSLTARATDAQGAATTSAPVGITLVAGNVGTVATPVISPSGGTFTGNTSVTIACATPSATIRYTTDGSTPTSSSPQYTTAISVSQTLTLKARAFKTGMNESPVQSATFTVTSGSSNGTQATFIREDAATLGDWNSAYGSQGYHVFGTSSSYPAYVTVAASGKQDYTWTDSSSDLRALLKPGSDSSRIASVWYSATELSINTSFTDTLTHRVAIYCLDWDNLGRVQTVELFDAVSGALLDTRTISNFSEGKYLVWNIKGNVRFRFQKSVGPNAIVSGLFFDPPATPPGIAPVAMNSSGLVLRVSGQTGGNYTVQYSESLNGWTTLTNVTLTSPQVQVLDANAKSRPHRFYRLAP
ncbi:MAG: chitobiase/beta-hexosaminidase C-terminal domain-containing protein [Verrucomicrobiota bacterium]|nr:chitobiase/beta-hexosaminidase C-terminal domain-containing protein [Verrucomicrobiota bacterium]